MDTKINTHPVQEAVSTLCDQLRFALAAPPDAETACELAKELIRIHDLILWCRDATVQVAKDGGASWITLQDTTGTPDATLASRLRRWQRDERRNA